MIIGLNLYRFKFILDTSFKCNLHKLQGTYVRCDLQEMSMTDVLTVHQPKVL